MEKTSASEKYRKLGNEIFKTLKQEAHLPALIHRSRFTGALNYYMQALNSSLNDEERASAYKNIGALFTYEIASFRTSAELTDKKTIRYNLNECIKSYGYAFQFGNRVI